jgi:hypothetical protein
LTATLGSGEWGAGGVSLRAAEERRLTDDRADELMGQDAKEAIASLAAEIGADKLDLEVPDFPGPVAEAFYWDDGTLPGIQGPVGSGKTTTVLKSRLRRAMAMPRSTIDGVRRYKLLVIRATYRQLWSTTIPDFLSVYPAHMGEWSGGKGGPATFVMHFDDGHGRIEFTVEFMAFGDDIQGAMRGYQATDIWLHEMDTNPIDVILNGITRINRYPGKAHFEGYPAELRDYGQIVGDFNAPEPDSWVTDLYLNKEKRAAVLKQLNAALPKDTKPIVISYYRQPGFGEPGAENLQNLGPGYYPTQIATLTLLGRGDTIDRLVYNKVVHTLAGEPVFKREFNRRIHVSDATVPPLPGVPLRIGLDQGLKGAATISQFITPFHWRILGELHFPKEWLLAKVFGERLAAEIERRWPGFRVEAAWADMAGEQGSSLAAEENETWNRLVGQAAGFRVRPQRIGTNRIQPRLEAVRAALEAPMHGGLPGLLIDPSCSYLIAGFEARYVWTFEVNQNGDKRKVPDKSLTEANVMDALQYLLLSEVRGNGLMRNSFPDTPGLMGHNGGPPLHGGRQGGLQTGYDLLNPYGGL